MLDKVVTLLNQEVEPFTIYYQKYICKVQDEAIDDEVNRNFSQISLYSELSQIKKLQKLLKNL